MKGSKKPQYILDFRTVDYINTYTIEEIRRFISEHTCFTYEDVKDKGGAYCSDILFGTFVTGWNTESEEVNRRARDMCIFIEKKLNRIKYYD